jgi:hypothetical protein
MMQIKDQLKYASTVKKNDVIGHKVNADALVLAVDMVLEAYEKQGFSAFSLEVEHALNDLAVSAGWLPEDLNEELKRRTIAVNAAVQEQMRKFGN